jgi:Ca2+-binding EF-hand superfamily protein
MGQGMAMRLQGIDANGDGKLQGGELMAWRESVFDAMDADSDDALSKAEFMAVRMGPGADPDRTGPRFEQMQAMKAAEFDAMDTDRDGRISRDQFIDAAAAAFTAADADGDGALTAAEMPRMHRR